MLKILSILTIVVVSILSGIKGVITDDINYIIVMWLTNIVIWLMLICFKLYDNES
jgi:lipopolysaccharide export LptBFGC system permease protein LptF